IGERTYSNFQKFRHIDKVWIFSYLRVVLFFKKLLPVSIFNYKMIQQTAQGSKNNHKKHGFKMIFSPSFQIFANGMARFCEKHFNAIKNSFVHVENSVLYFMHQKMKIDTFSIRFSSTRGAEFLQSFRSFCIVKVFVKSILFLNYIHLNL